MVRTDRCALPLNALPLWFIRWRMTAYDRRKSAPTTGKATWHHLYKTAHWQRLRTQQLANEPLCRMCLVTEDVTAADVVDHIKPHKGDVVLFHDPANLQSLCKHHHDSAKAMIDRGKRVVTYGIDGYPIELG